MSVLVEPVVNEARDAAVKEAREEAESNAIAAVTQELTAQQAESGDGMLNTMYVHVHHVHVSLY